MNALDVISNIINNEYLFEAQLKYCLVDDNKVPYKINGETASPNKPNDFTLVEDLLNCSNLQDYRGVGISIQASNICAIDVDHCFKEPFVLESGDERADDIINTFKDFAYIEFSFSGKGLRVLFIAPVIKNYDVDYYIKNSKYGIEYYQPGESNRYVTITGRTIINNPIKNISNPLILSDFLNKYMIRKNKKVTRREQRDCSDSRNMNELQNLVRYRLIKDMMFQNLWFDKAPGSGSNESERDYHLVAYLYQYITKDPLKIKELFEQSEFFKTKDKKHIRKWEKNDFAYYNNIYSAVEGKYLNG